MPLFNLVITVYIGLLVARLFVPVGGEVYFNPLLRIIVRMTEPVVRLFRTRLLVTRTGLDVAPLVAAVLAALVRGFVLGLGNGLEAASALLQSATAFLDLLYGCWGVLLLGLMFISLGGAFACSRISQMIMAVTDPFMRPVRRLTGYRERGLDWAPLIGLFMLVAIRAGIVVAITYMAGTHAETFRIWSEILLSARILLNTLVSFLMVVIIARAIVSWMNIDPYNPLVQTIILFTDPVLAPIRRIMPTSSVGLDFSPLLAMILLMGLRYVINGIT